MCMTTSLAELSNTRIYVGEGAYNDKYVHVLAYQNTAISKGPNAIVLPFPSSVPMSQENVIDTRSFPSFLDDITQASKQLTLSMRGYDSDDSDGFMVFDVGSYTVVLADNVLLAQNAVEQVSKEKRPSISDAFVQGYSKLYPKHSVAICCWNGSIKPEPLLWWYEPSNKDCFFMPTMDAHDGNPPNLDEVVRVDHILSVGSSDDSKIGHHFRVNYSDKIPDFVKGLLPNFVFGTEMSGAFNNGDVFINKNALSNRILKMEDLPKANRGVSIDEITHSFEMGGWS